MHTAKTVFVGLSGGVDSAVSAALLQKAGHNVVGVFIRIVLPGYPCPAVADRQDAMRVAAHLRIPFQEIDLSKEYATEVFAYTLSEFALGRTPNPDTLCNEKIKFGLFFNYALAQGADMIATGHYAQLRTTAEGSLLYTSHDPDKDQSYFLWMVPEQALARSLFPVGGMAKSQVRKLALKFKLPNATRKDSQGLCFLGDISIGDMLTAELHPSPGLVLDSMGSPIGEHRGVQLYTLGQRHGFTVLSHAHSGEQTPLYVVGKNLQDNTITVSSQQFPTGIAKTRLVLGKSNWIGAVASGEYLARYRYRQPLMPATYSKEEGVVTLGIAQYVPEGQSVVLYEKNTDTHMSLRCFGGGIVDKSTLC